MESRKEQRKEQKKRTNENRFLNSRIKNYKKRLKIFWVTYSCSLHDQQDLCWGNYLKRHKWRTARTARTKVFGSRHFCLQNLGPLVGNFLLSGNFLEHVYMRPEVNSNWFEISNGFENSFRFQGNFTTSNLQISNCFQKLFCLNGYFTAATFQTIARLYCTCANDIF